MPWPSGVNNKCVNNKKRKISLVPSGSVQDHFHDYCMSTSIHGIRYLGEKDRPVGERLWWMLIFVLSIVGNSYLIGKVWNKWKNNPVIVSFAETTTPVWQVPFPAITICPEVKTARDQFNFTEAYLLPHQYMEKKSALSMFCDPQIVIEDGNPVMSELNIAFLLVTAPSLNSTLRYCKWKSGEPGDCNWLFNMVITEDGFCFTFNVLKESELFRDNLCVKVDILNKQIINNFNFTTRNYTDKDTINNGLKSLID